MPVITTLISDFGCVITHPQDLTKVDAMMGLLGLEVAREEFQRSYTRHRGDYDAGLTDAPAYWRLVGRDFGVEVGESLAERLVPLDLASWFNINGSVVELLREKRREVRQLALLSNINFDGTAHIEKTQGDWLGLFDEKIYSCEERLLKPQREIYELVVTRLGTEPERCLLVDDNRDNIAGCRGLGMHGIVFTDIEDLRLQLAEYSFQA